MRLVAVFCALFGFVVQGHALAQAPRQAFSDAERRRLEAGELVSRPWAELRHGQRLVGGISWQKVDLPAQRVWRAALDINLYPHLFPKLSSAQLLSDKSGTRTVLMHHQHGPFDVRYTMEFSLTPAKHDMHFRMISTKHPMLKAMWGFMTVVPTGHNSSILCYGIMGDIGSGLIQAWARPYLQTKLLRVPHYLKRYLERRNERVVANVPS